MLSQHPRPRIEYKGESIVKSQNAADQHGLGEVSLAHALAPAGQAWGEAARGKAAKGRAAKGRTARGRATRRQGRGREAPRPPPYLPHFGENVVGREGGVGRKRGPEERSRGGQPRGGGPGGPRGNTVPASHLLLALRELRFQIKMRWMHYGSVPGGA